MASSGLPGFPVLAFLVWNVLIAAFVPKMAAGCPPEVTLVSVDRASAPRSGQRGGKSPVNRGVDGLAACHFGCRSGRGLPSSHPRLLRDRHARLERDGQHSGRATVRVAHHQPGVLDVETLRRRRGEQSVGRRWRESSSTRRATLTCSFSMARAAMLALLKLTKAQNLSCSTRMLSISPCLRGGTKQLRGARRATTSGKYYTA